MKKGWLLLVALSFAGCAKSFEEFTPEQLQTASDELWGSQIEEKQTVSGTMNILVSEGLAAELEAQSSSDGKVRTKAVKSIMGSQFTYMERLFPPAGKFEARTRAEGMHLWYIVKYNPQTRASTAAARLMQIPGVEKMEVVPHIRLVGNPVVVSREDSPSATAENSGNTNLPFDDPMLSRQWHYYNNGSLSTAVSGCDINVFPVWKKLSTGDQDVIVSVVDGGVDYNHEDLKDNMWHNPNQKGENIYGYNFVQDTYNIHPEDHGTHVAGTIAAVNNNGKGLCGIAGGNSKKKVKGVKIMSCQIFDGNGDGNSERAIKWGADNGAVISQNSWEFVGVSEAPSSLKAAVDYFVKYAGVDENGSQTGPMKGGLVVFAAGNSDTDSYCSNYDKMFTVTSVGPDFRRAYYSNYGPAADIAAPGGDYKKGAEIWSTLPGDKYGKMQGTSMACPHISGVAALILSVKKGDGYTPAELRKAIENTATDISSFNKNHHMGKGLANTYLAIAGMGGKAPEAPSSLTASANSNNVTFSVKVPKDADDDVPQSIYVYYSEKTFSKLDASLSFASFYVDDLKAGDMFSGVVHGLDFNKTYYLAAVAGDLAGNKSGLSNIVTVYTTDNHKPQITVLNGVEATIKPHESVKMDFKITDPDGHFVYPALRDSLMGWSLDTLDTERPSIIVSGPLISVSDEYETWFIASDAYGASDSVKVKVAVLENHKPEIVNTLEDKIYNSKAAITTEIKASDYFIDADGENLAYWIQLDNPSIFNMTEKNGKFSLTPMAFGYCKVKVTATDIRGENVSQIFRVLVRNGDSPVDIYPNPVVDVLTVRTSEKAQASVEFFNSVGAKVISMDIEIDPFEPARINIADLPSGEYTVTIKYDNQDLSYKIIKI